MQYKEVVILYSNDTTGNEVFYYSRSAFVSLQSFTKTVYL